MKVKLGDVRKLVREEYLRGVPEFLLRDLTSRYMESLRNIVERHIQSTSKDPIQMREKIEVANETLKDLEEGINRLVEEKLWSFTQRT